MSEDDEKGEMMSARLSTVSRTTNETDVFVKLDLDGTGSTEIDTGVPFFDHMLDAFGRHGLFDLTVRATGDVAVDAHHTVEDVGIVVGFALAEALGDKRGVNRFGAQHVPMDEALVLAAVDLSGRGQLHFDADLPFGCIGGTFDTQLPREFFFALASNAGMTLHVREIAGENAHHVIEAMFKAAGRALAEAVAFNERLGDSLPTTKGVL